MPILVADCPRCGAQRMTFEARGACEIDMAYSWQHRYELFAVCKHCWRSTIFVIEQRAADDQVSAFLEREGPMSAPGCLSDFMEVDGYISLKDKAAEPPPEHLPDDVEAAFVEGAKCLAVDCCNAAGAMFRLAIDLATKPLLPDPADTSINAKQRRDLGLRLQWLFDNAKLSTDLRRLSTAVREDGNEGAHQGTLDDGDAEDLLEFTGALLERMFTEPKRLELREQKRQDRRGEQKK